MRNCCRIVAAANRSHRVVVRHGRRQGGRATAAAEKRKRHLQLARQRCDRYVLKYTYYTMTDTPLPRLFLPKACLLCFLHVDLLLEECLHVPDESQSTVSPIGPDELPPPYQSATQGGMPMVTCRVCQAMIDISGKRDQHVVKCCQCNEATVCVKAHLSSTFVSLHISK